MKDVDRVSRQSRINMALLAGLFDISVVRRCKVDEQIVADPIKMQDATVL